LYGSLREPILKERNVICHMRSHTVTRIDNNHHPSNNWARRTANSSIETNVITTTPNHCQNGQQKGTR